jgi:site-specific recombinase XerD
MSNSRRWPTGTLVQGKATPPSKPGVRDQGLGVREKQRSRRKEEPSPLKALIQEHLTDAYTNATTRETYGYTLKGFCAFLATLGVQTPQQIKKAHLDAYGATLDGMEPVTVMGRLHRVKRFFDWLLKKEILLTSPAAHLRLHKPEPPIRIPLSEEEINGLLNAPDVGTILGLRDRAILETLYATGMRVSELLALHLQDVDLADHTAFIRKGKGGYCRWVPLTEAAVDFIRAYLDKARPALAKNSSTAFLFISGMARPLCRQYLQVLCRRYAKQAGIERRVWLHLLRYTAACHLLGNGATVFHVQLLLGHGKLSSTQRYTPLTLPRLQEIHTRCHPRN